jgi:hypothetical protein
LPVELLPSIALNCILPLPANGNEFPPNPYVRTPRNLECSDIALEG